MTGTNKWKSRAGYPQFVDNLWITRGFLVDLLILWGFPDCGYFFADNPINRFYTAMEQVLHRCYFYLPQVRMRGNPQCRYKRKQEFVLLHVYFLVFFIEFSFKLL